MDKILLIGNPNVGKSAIFSRLTGVKVMISNYPGTTIEFTQGNINIAGRQYTVIDIPGIYSLKSDIDAELVALKMLEDLSSGEDRVILLNIIDSTNLERNLNLTLQLIKRKLPMLLVLNLWDETEHRGIDIDIEKLGKKLDITAVPTVGLTGFGIKELVEKVPAARASSYDYEENTRWDRIGEIITEVQKLSHSHHSFLQRLEELSVNPVTGLPIAAGILSLVFFIIRYIGEGFIKYIGDPAFENLWTPVVKKLSFMLGSGGMIHDILIGKLSDGQISYSDSLGMLTTGLYVPLVDVLPYIFAFYAVLSFLEDFGYLPRLSVLVDNLMHKLGLHGYSIVPFMLGFGCNVPGALSTRVMSSRRERFIVVTLMAISVPCMAQTAMIFGLLGKYQLKGVPVVFLTLFFVAVIMGMIMNVFMKGNAGELFLEIPPYRWPYPSALAKKIFMRILWFVKEALPWVLIGVLFVNIMYLSGIIKTVSRFLEPLVSGVMGLPGDAVSALIIGFLRKDVAVGMLIPLNMELKQLIIASVVLTMYFPCIATFTTMLKEFGVKDTFKAAFIMLSSTILVGATLNLILH